MTAKTTVPGLTLECSAQQVLPAAGKEAWPFLEPPSLKARSVVGTTVAGVTTRVLVVTVAVV